MLKQKPINIISLISLILMFPFLTLKAQESTASSNVSILNIFSPQLNAHTTIRLYLPQGYMTNKSRYAVIYMHDAQNLFDRNTSFSGEWKVDEALDSLRAKTIIVGIDHGGEKRLEQLTPYPNPKHGGGNAQAYMDFIVNTLKPHIDSLYRTKPDANNTAIMGSSLGGLVSLYAVIKYPNVFGKAGVFSPALWYTNDIFKMVESAENISSKIYMMAGDSEDDDMVPDIERMKGLLLKRMPAKNLLVKIVPGGKHNEALWANEFPGAYLWLIKK